MSVKRTILITVSIMLILFIVLLIFTFPWWLIAVGLYFSPAPPKPEITYGEFDFKLVYEINGEIRTVEDTIVCEFDGFNVDEGRGKTRRWKEKFKNEQGNELYAFRAEDPAYYKKSKSDYNKIVLENTGHYKIVLGVANAEYFLGEPENKQKSPITPSIEVYDMRIGYYKDPQEGNEFLKKYDFKVLSWKCDEPIQNTFQ